MTSLLSLQIPLRCSVGVPLLKLKMVVLGSPCDPDQKIDFSKWKTEGRAAETTNLISP